MAKSDHEVQQVIVSRPIAPLPAGEVEFDAFVAAHAPLAKPAATGPDDPGFWLYSSGSTGRPKGTVHTHANPYWTAELYGKPRAGPDASATSASRPPSCSSPTAWAMR